MLFDQRRIWLPLLESDFLCVDVPKREVLLSFCVGATAPVSFDKCLALGLDAERGSIPVDEDSRFLRPAALHIETVTTPTWAFEITLRAAVSVAWT